MIESGRKILYVEGSPYANYPANPKRNVGGSLISLIHTVRALNKNEFRPSLFLYYDSFLVDKLRIQDHEVFIKTKGYRRGKTKKPVHVLFGKDDYLFLSYLKMSFLRMVPSAVRMYSFLKKEKPAIVHCNNSLWMNMDAILASHWAGIPCLCHVRRYERLYLINRMCAHFVECFICISDAVRSNYFRQGIKRDQLIVIPNGLDIQDFPVSVRENQAGHDFIITTIGRMIDWKGHRVLLEAIPGVIKERKDVQFWFVGEGEERRGLEERASDLNVGRYVKFKGIAPDIRPILSSSDLIVHVPTRPEPFGRVIIEAMSMEKPVIATNLGGPREIISDGQDGVLIEPRRPDQLADRILHLLGNPEWRQNIGNAARKTVERRYDNKQIVKEVERIYRGVLKRNMSKRTKDESRRGLQKFS